MKITQELKDWWFMIFDHLIEMFPNGGIFEAARSLNIKGHPDKSLMLENDVEDILALLSIYIDERPHIKNLSTKELLKLLR